MAKQSLCFLIILLLMFSWSLAQKTLFQLLSPEESGIYFENTIKDNKETNIFKYANYYGGSGVGIADFNNDGLQDIYLCGNLVGDKIYLNQGDLKFKDVTESAGIKDDQTWSSGVAIADVNNDGLNDIYVCKELYDDEPKRRKNKLYINQGNMTFTEEAEKWGVSNMQRTRHAVFFDYNKDGRLDLFILNQPPNPGSLSSFFGKELLLAEYTPKLYKNVDNKHFIDITQEAQLQKTGFPNSAVAGDINNDGWTDLYIANDFDAPDFLYINNKDGTFDYKTNTALKHTSFYSMGVDMADINNDGHQDIMVLDMVAEDNFRQKSNMSAMNSKTFWKVVKEGGHYQYMYNTMQLNNGNLSFSDVAQYAGIASTDWSWSNLIADFDNDGHKDIYITNGILKDIRNTDANKKISSYISSLINQYLIENGNQNDINIWDILPLEKVLKMLPSVPLKNYMYKYNGKLKFDNMASVWGMNQATFSNGSAYGDLDNDGDLELVVNNINEKTFLYKNNAIEIGNNNFIRIRLKPDKEKNVTHIGTKLALYTGHECQRFEITTARGMYSTSETIAHFGLGKYSKADSLIIYWPKGGKKIYHNLSANKLHDIRFDKKFHNRKPKPKNQPLFNDVTKKTNILFTHKENEFDDFEKQMLLPHKLSQLGPAIAVGDVNNDGLDDLFFGGASNQSAQLFLQNNDGKFYLNKSETWYRHKSLEDLSAAFFDADNDGDQDLYVVSGGNEFAPNQSAYLDRLYINDGNGNFLFERERIPNIYESGSVVKPQDFDKDGDIDLFIGNRMIPWNYPEPSSSYILENINGYFSVHQQSKPLFDKIGLVTDAVWLDGDSDNDVDLIVVGEWMSIKYFENKNGNLYPNNNSTLENLKGWWYSIQDADIDNDGDIDLVVGNLGLNYKYKASEKEPFRILYHDFDENGKKDIVLTYYNQGVEYPLRGFSCSSNQIPALKGQFKHYNVFANLNIQSAYGNKINDAYQLEATHFENMLLINDGKGNFHSKPLPYNAQLSSINDIIINDFDKDNIPDILTIGNMFHAEVETPRNDASIGNFLKGDGASFENQPVSKSGFFAPKDAKKMRHFFIGNQPHILVANNNDSIQIFAY